MGVIHKICFMLAGIFLFQVEYSIPYDIDQHSNTNLQLSPTLFPESYKLKIFVELDPENFSFWGDVTIQLLCNAATNVIQVNFYKLKIMMEKIVVVEVIGDQQRQIAITSVDPDDENQILNIRLDEELKALGSYEVYIPFVGYLDTALVGLYRSSYLDRDTKTTKWLAVTQADPIYARRIFPCMDQPDIKSYFHVSVGHRKNFKALSNMAVKSSDSDPDDPEWVLDVFKPTKPMPTYLIGFVVTEFEFIEVALPSTQIPVRLWSRKESLDQLEFASRIIVDALEYFGNYFNFPYPLEKMDIVAVPDFLYTGKEGYGLVTFRESAILIDPKSSPAFDQVMASIYTAQCMASQWIGGSVTPQLWNEVWMKEGFSRYLSRIFVRDQFPDWETIDVGSIVAFLESLAADELYAAHPLTVAIDSLSEIDLLYDTITIQKGSFVVHMMSIFLGEAVMQRALSSFVAKFKDGGVRVDFLWETFNEVATNAQVLPEGIDVKTVMDSWILKPNYPLVTVARDIQSGTVTVNQKRYVFNPDGEAEDENNSGWWLPLHYTTSVEMDFEKNPTAATQWLTSDGPTTIQVDLGEQDWILFNLRITALCRINYDSNNWALIRQTLLDEQQFTNIGMFSRAQLISDMHGLAWIGEMDYQFMLETLSFIKYETELPVWRMAWAVLSSLRSMVSRTNIKDSFQNFVRSLMEPMFLKFGDINEFPDDDNVFYAQFKRYFISWACAIVKENCQKPAIELFQKWFDSEDPDTNNPIQKNIRGTVYCQWIVAFGGLKEWDFLWIRYLNTDSASERTVILRALGCSKDTELLNRYLEMSIDPNLIRPQDSPDIFTAMSTNDASVEVTRDFFFNRFDAIYQFHRGNQVALGKYLLALYARVMTAEDLEKLNSFVESNADRLHNADLRLKEGMDVARDNISWQTRNFGALSKALQNIANL